MADTQRDKALEILRRKRKKLRKLKRKRRLRGNGIGGKIAAARLAGILLNPTGTYQITALQARAYRASKARWLRHPPTLTAAEEAVMASYDTGMPAHQVQLTHSITKQGLVNIRNKAARVKKWRGVAAAIAADPRLIDMPTDKPRTGVDLPGAQKGYIDGRNPAAPRMVYAEGFEVKRPITVGSESSSEAPGGEGKLTTSPVSGATCGDAGDTGAGGAGSPSCNRGDTESGGAEAGNRGGEQGNT